MRRISLEEAFWSKVDQRGADECWPWTGALGSKGYGVIHRRSNGRSAMLRATQVSWALANGKPWPKPLFACHSCDNPQCVNPAHIWPGTNAENMTDMFDKGRRRAWVCRHAGTPTFGTQGMSRCRACRSEYDRERSQLRTQRRREAKLARQAESRSMNTQSQIQAAATRNRGERTRKSAAAAARNP